MSGQVGSAALTIGTRAGKPDGAALILAGRLDAVASLELRERLDALLGQGFRTLVIDLVDVEFVDSAGLAALVRARRLCREQGGDVVLIRPRGEDAMRVFRLTQFDEVFLLAAGRPA